jgi:hypothetical protein
MAELQRQIQAQRVRTQVEDVLDRAAVDRASPQGRQMLDLVGRLEEKVTEPPLSFGRASRDVGVQLETQLQQLIDQKAPDNPDFADAPPVKTLAAATDLLKTQRATSYDAELEHHLLADRTLGGGLKLFSRNGG